MKKSSGKTKTVNKHKQKTTMKKMGPAATLAGSDWISWLNHVLKEGTSWLFVVLILTHLLCLRVTEALRLRGSDFSFKRSDSSVFVAALKRQKPTRKPLLQETKMVLKRLKDVGVKQKRVRDAGARGRQVFWDHWMWPQKESGLLFPAKRMDSNSQHKTKDTVCKAIARLRKTYKQAVDGVIRSHSGRHSMINLLKTSRIPDPVGMQFARISNPKVYEQYGHLTGGQLSALLKKNKALQGSLKQQYQGLVLGKKTKGRA